MVDRMDLGGVTSEIHIPLLEIELVVNIPCICRLLGSAYLMHESFRSGFASLVLAGQDGRLIMPFCDCNKSDGGYGKHHEDQ